MSRYVLLTSFPKSGNTWIRFILANYFKKESSHTVDFTNINEVMPTVYSPDWNSSALIDGSPLCIKEHASYHDLPEYSFWKTIYITRNGMDALWSYWHFANAQAPNRYSSFENFISCYWTNYGHWGDHVLSWYNQAQKSPGKVMVIRYEDFQENDIEAARRCLEFLHVDVDEERLHAAVYASRKDKMKKLSNSTSFMKSQDKSFHFVRSGVSGDGVQHFTESTRERFFAKLENLNASKIFSYISPQEAAQLNSKTDPAYRLNTLWNIILCRWGHNVYRLKRLRQIIKRKLKN